MMFRLVRSVLHRPPSLMFTRLTSRRSVDEPRVRLHPGNQYTVEEIAQGVPEKQRKRQIEDLYEFEKLEINNQPSTRDEYRHTITRLLTLFIRCLCVLIVLGGEKGVFDLEEILQILRDERMRDLCVIEIPPDQQYARYLILATAFSARHLKSTSEYINKLVRI